MEKHTVEYGWNHVKVFYNLEEAQDFAYEQAFYSYTTLDGKEYKRQF